MSRLSCTTTNVAPIRAGACVTARCSASTGWRTARSPVCRCSTSIRGTWPTSSLDRLPVSTRSPDPPRGRGNLGLAWARRTRDVVTSSENALTRARDEFVDRAGRRLPGDQVATDGRVRHVKKREGRNGDVRLAHRAEATAHEAAHRGDDRSVQGLKFRAELLGPLLREILTPVQQHDASVVDVLS